MSVSWYIHESVHEDEARGIKRPQSADRRLERVQLPGPPPDDGVYLYLPRNPTTFDQPLELLLIMEPALWHAKVVDGRDVRVALKPDEGCTFYTIRELLLGPSPFLQGQHIAAKFVLYPRDGGREVWRLGSGLFTLVMKQDGRKKDTKKTIQFLLPPTVFLGSILSKPRYIGVCGIFGTGKSTTIDTVTSILRNESGFAATRLGGGRSEGSAGATKKTEVVEIFPWPNLLPFNKDSITGRFPSLLDMAGVKKQHAEKLLPLMGSISKHGLNKELDLSCPENLEEGKIRKAADDGRISKITFDLSGLLLFVPADLVQALMDDEKAAHPFTDLSLTIQENCGFSPVIVITMLDKLESLEREAEALATHHAHAHAHAVAQAQAQAQAQAGSDTDDDVQMQTQPMGVSSSSSSSSPPLLTQLKGAVGLIPLSNPVVSGWRARAAAKLGVPECNVILSAMRPDKPPQGAGDDKEVLFRAGVAALYIVMRSWDVAKNQRYRNFYHVNSKEATNDLVHVPDEIDEVLAFRAKAGKAGMKMSMARGQDEQDDDHDDRKPAAAAEVEGQEGKGGQEGKQAGDGGDLTTPRKKPRTEYAHDTDGGKERANVVTPGPGGSEEKGHEEGGSEEGGSTCCVM